MCEGHGHDHQPGNRDHSQTPSFHHVHLKALSKNDRVAGQLRERWAREGCYVVELCSSPGAGKTELLAQTLARLLARGRRVAAIVGDLATDLDAVRLRASGAPVRQIETGTLCHLEAGMVAQELGLWGPGRLEVLFLENVGNLVCPAAYDLGQDLRVALVSTPEGEDKPLKYPPLFNRAELALITKMDLAEPLGFDREQMHRSLQSVHPGVEVLELSARSGFGLDAWLERLESLRRAKQDQRLAAPGP